LVGSDREISSGSRKGVVVEPFQAAFATELVGVVPLDPGDAGIEGRFALNRANLAGRRAHGVHATLAVRPQHSLKNRKARSFLGSCRSARDAQHALQVEIGDGSVVLKIV